MNRVYGEEQIDLLAEQEELYHKLAEQEVERQNEAETKWLDIDKNNYTNAFANTKLEGVLSIWILIFLASKFISEIC